MSKFKKRVCFTIMQSLSDGSICRLGRLSTNSGLDLYLAGNSPPFFLYGATNQTYADGDFVKDENLYYVGVHTFKLVDGSFQSMHSYALTKNLARQIISGKK